MNWLFICFTLLTCVVGFIGFSGNCIANQEDSKFSRKDYLQFTLGIGSRSIYVKDEEINKSENGSFYLPLTLAYVKNEFPPLDFTVSPISHDFKTGERKNASKVGSLNGVDLEFGIRLGICTSLNKEEKESFFHGGKLKGPGLCFLEMRPKLVYGFHNYKLDNESIEDSTGISGYGLDVLLFNSYTGAFQFGVLGYSATFYSSKVSEYSKIGQIKAQSSGAIAIVYLGYVLLK